MINIVGWMFTSDGCKRIAALVDEQESNLL